MKFRIVRNHHIELQLLTEIFFDWRTNQTATMGSHKVDGLGGNMPRWENEIPFIFPLIVIRDNYHFSLSEVCQCRFYSIYFNITHKLSFR